MPPVAKPPGVLYPYIPKMAACDGCGRCCGPVTVTRREAAAIIAYMFEHQVWWHRSRSPLTCGFYDAGARACRIYPVRPFGCRLFGLAVEMVCPFYPEAAVLSFPTDRAVAEGWLSPNDGLLGDLVGAGDGE